MKRAVTFLWPAHNTSAKRQGETYAQVLRALEGGGDEIVATFTVPRGTPIHEALERFRLAVRFAQAPNNAISKLVVPSLDRVPDTFDTLSELAVQIEKSRLALVVLDLGVEVTTSTEVVDLRDEHGRRAVWKQKKSESIRYGMLSAKKPQGGTS